MKFNPPEIPQWVWLWRFALLPTRLSNGTWIWLEQYWERRESGYSPWCADYYVKWQENVGETK